MKITVKDLESLKRNSLFAKVATIAPDTLAWIKIMYVGQQERKYLIIYVEYEMALVELAYKYQQHLDSAQARKFHEFGAKDDDDLVRIVTQYVSDTHELIPSWRIEKPF